jgi:hypothetical protein
MEPMSRSTKGPGRPGGDEDFANLHGLDSPHELIAVDTVTITEKVGRSRIIWERIDKLPGGPSCRGMVGDVEMEEFALFMPEDDEDEEEAEGKGGDHEEVDGDELADVRGEKGAPRGRRPGRRRVHVVPSIYSVRLVNVDFRPA